KHVLISFRRVASRSIGKRNDMRESRLRYIQNIFISSIILRELLLRAYAGTACGVIAFYSPECVGSVITSPWKSSTNARQKSFPCDRIEAPSRRPPTDKNYSRGDLILQAKPIGRQSGI